MLKIFSFLFCCAMLFYRFPANGQQYLFDHFTMSDGLPSNTNYRCATDADGFVWIATSGGVTRFDGKSFEVFHESDGLPDNDITYLLADHKNRIWFFGFNGGVSFYQQNSIHTVATDPWLKSLQTESFVVYSLEDPQHNIYLANGNGTFQCITSKDSVILFSLRGNLFFAHNKVWCLQDKVAGASRHLMYSLSDSSSIATPAVLLNQIIRKQTIAPSIHGNLFCAAYKNLYLASSKDLTIQKIGTAPAPISSLKYISDSVVALFAPAHGVYFFNLLRKKITAHLLDGETLSDALMNINGDLWCTSLNNGLFYLPACRSNARYIIAKEHLPNERCTAIYADSSNTIWIGMDDAAVQRSTKESTHIFPLSERKNIVGRVNSIVYTKAGYIAIASDLGLYLIDKDGTDLKPVRMYMAADQKLVQLRAVKSCSVAPNGDLLIAATNFAHRLSVDEMAKAQPVAMPVRTCSDRVLYAFEDNRKQIWLATLKGLIKINGSDTIKLFQQNRLLAKRILQIGQMPRGYIVLATDGAGILILKDDKVCAQITRRNGLPSDICRRIFICGDSLYTATAEGAGIVGYNKQQGIFVHAVTGKDGLLNVNCRDLAVANDSLYVATDRGICILPLPQLFQANAVPNIYLKSIAIDGKPAMVTNNELSFAYGAKSVQVNYGAVSQNTTAGVEYRYRITPHSPWTVTDTPSLRYNDPPLKHTQVTIQSRYKGGAWSKELLLHIHVLPRFYQETWFAAVMFCIGGLAVVGALFYYLRKKRRQVLTRNKLMKLESQANQAMMNPHFVFNALNSVQHFLNDHDNYAANQYLSRFSRLIRRHMELNRKQYLSLAEEFEFLKLYLEVEKNRSDDQLSFHLEIQSGIDPDETFIPVLILQPLAENAVWHGIHPKGGGFISIVAKINSGNSLEISVTDDGVGLSDKTGSVRQSIGLGIIQDRLHLLTKLYGQPFSIAVQNIKSGGVRATVHFPVLKNPDLLYV